MTKSCGPEGARGNRGAPPERTRRCGAPAAARRELAGESAFPPRDRAAGEGGQMTFGHLASEMGDIWSVRAEGYRTSATHMRGDDLDALVVMCEPGEGVKALDVAT